MNINIKFARNSYAWLLIILMAFGATTISAQSKSFTIKGKVIDQAKKPIVGVTIIVTPTNTGTTTDINGDFSIKVAEGQSLTFSSIGYVSQTIKVSNSVTQLNITMQDDTQLVDDVVVIGYGKVLKKDLTGSIESLSSKELTKAMNVNVTESLNGRVSGVLVTKTSNRPGADMSMQIRGKNSINYSNEPLYVIDGVTSYSGMRNINAEDIESIDVLKDASSCAIYGSRGSNGVVIVTTKGANKTEGFNVEFNTYVGLKTPTRLPDMLGSEGNGMEYVDFRIKQWTNKFGASSLMRPDFLTADERRHVKNGEYYDWLREFAQDAITTNNTLSITGGSDKTSYTFGMGYMTDGGIAGSEDFERITSNIGLEQRLSKRWRTGMNAYVSLNTINHGSTDALYSAYLITPIVGRYQPDGTPTFSHRPDGRVNPFLQDANSRHISEGWSVNTSAFIEFKPVKTVAIKSQLAMQYDGAENGNWEGTDTQYGQGVKSPNSSRSEGVNSNWVWDNTVTYDKTFADIHKLNVIGLFSMQKESHKSSGMVGEGMPYESDWYGIQTADQITGVNSGYWEASMISFMARVNYVLMDKYLFTVTSRYDGTSRLAGDNRWGLLPSAAIGWQIKNEKFMEDIKWVSALKLRASWGKTGNNNVGHDETISKLGLNPYSFGGVGIKGFGMNGKLGNENLRWEMTSEFNYGADFGFLNNRINGSVDVYFRKTKDLIMQRQVAKLNGYRALMENSATTSNRGVEFTLNTINISKKDFTWTTNLTFSLNRNKILDLDGTKTDDLANQLFIGHPMGAYYDVKQIGIWQIEEKAEAEKFGAAPGWPKILDYNPDGVIDAKDMHIQGARTPDWTAGMTNSFTYKNFDLSVYMYARVGGYYGDNFTYFFTGINNQDWNKLDVPYWTPENRNNKYPGIGLESLWTQTLSKVSGTFLKIQNITCGYTFNSKLLKKIKMQNLRIYASVQNPFTFSDYLGSDPEIMGEELDKQLSLYPMTFSVGLNVKF